MKKIPFIFSNLFKKYTAVTLVVTLANALMTYTVVTLVITLKIAIGMYNWCTLEFPEQLDSVIAWVTTVYFINK